MSLNKQQKALLANVENIFNTLVSVKVPQDVLQAQMATWITDFEDKVPEHRLHIVMGETPRLEVIDCSRDNAKMARDSSQYLTLRARLLNTRLTAIVASRDSTTSNAVVAQSLRELAGLIEKMPFELSSQDSVDLFEVLGIKHAAGNQDDDQGVDLTTDEHEAPVVAPAPVVAVPMVEAAAVAESTVVEQAPVAAQEDKSVEGDEEPLIALVSVSEEEAASL
jgi:hypothetical protein